MASGNNYLQFILGQLSDLDDITYRAMMGEFIIYYRGKIVGGIYDDRLLVKPTKSAIAHMADPVYEAPYEGAKDMTQEERLDYLIHYLCEDSVQYRGLRVEKAERRATLRSLMNIRMPGHVSAEFLEIQDAFLQKEAWEKGIVDVEHIPTIREAYGITGQNSTRISLWQGDITRLSEDAIVNDATARQPGCLVP